jgi:hypothetical protein
LAAGFEPALRVGLWRRAKATPAYAVSAIRSDGSKSLTSDDLHVLVLFMGTPPQIADSDICLLDELSALGMAMSRDLQGRCSTVGEARDAAHLALGFQRSSRSVRQCIALKAKLLRDQVRHGREDQAHAARQDETRMLIRKAQVRLSVERAVWNEADGPEAERLLGELDDILEAETFSDDFVQGHVQTHIARICDALGVTPLAGSGAGDLASPGGGGGASLHGLSPAPDEGGEAAAPADPPLRQSSG